MRFHSARNVSEVEAYVTVELHVKQDTELTTLILSHAARFITVCHLVSWLFAVRNKAALR